MITITATRDSRALGWGMQAEDHQQDWRARAQEMRTIGEKMRDQTAREEMLRLANKYERLADWKEPKFRSAH